MAHDATRDPAMSLSPPQASITAAQTSSVSADFGSFFANMEKRNARTLTHQRSMIEVPAGILNLKDELDDSDHEYEDDDNDNGDSSAVSNNKEKTPQSNGNDKNKTESAPNNNGNNKNNGNENANGVSSPRVEIKDDDSIHSDDDEEGSSYEIDDQPLNLKDAGVQMAISRKHDPNLESSDDEEDSATHRHDTDTEFSHSRDRSAAKIEVPLHIPNISASSNIPSTLSDDTADAPPKATRQLSPYQDKRSSEIEAPTSPADKTNRMRTFSKRKLNLVNENENENGNASNNNNNNNDTTTTTANGTTTVTVSQTDEKSYENENESKNNNNNNYNNHNGDESVPLKDSTPSFTPSDADGSTLLRQSSHRKRSHRSSGKRTSRRSVHRATIANYFDEDEQKSDDDFNTFNPNDNEPSMTMNIDVEFWKSPKVEQNNNSNRKKEIHNCE